MSAHRKLTDEQIRFARATVQKRRDAIRVASMYPTLAELAADLDVTPRYLSEVVNGRARVGTSDEPVGASDITDGSA